MTGAQKLWRRLRGPPGPTFLCVGAMRAGTSTVHRLLRQHPEVFVPKRKELHFWNRPNNTNIRAYHANFAGGEEYAARGETTPAYGFMPAVPERLYRYNPALKLIYVVRDPVKRAISNIYHRANRRKLVDIDVLEELRADIAQQGRFEGCGYIRSNRCYHMRGHYHAQLTRLTRYFPREQILILRLEDLVDDPEGQSAELYRFVGVQPEPVSLPHVNKAQYPDASREAVEYLSTYYRLHNEALAEDFGVSLEGWL